MYRERWLNDGINADVLRLACRVGGGWKWGRKYEVNRWRQTLNGMVFDKERPILFKEIRQVLRSYSPSFHKALAEDGESPGY